MQDRDSSQTPRALPALLAALLGVVGAVGPDILSPIAFAFILLPACEAALAAPDAAEHESAPPPGPRRPRPTWRAAAAPAISRLDPRARPRAQRGSIDGVLLPLLA